MAEELYYVIDLPFPPSVNAIYGRAKTGHVFMSAAYKLWLKDADVHGMTQKVGKLRALNTFSAELLLAYNKGQGDADNRLKVVLDWAKRAGLIVDDSKTHAHEITVKWVIADLAPKGCRLILKGLTK